PKGIWMTPTDRLEQTTGQLDAIAWKFLRSEFTGQIYSDWPIDRRLDAYLLHYGPTELINDGSAYNALLERVMANIGPALRNGVLPSPKNWEPPASHHQPRTPSGDLIDNPRCRARRGRRLGTHPATGSIGGDSRRPDPCATHQPECRRPHRSRVFAT